MKSQCKITKLSLELINPICKEITSFCKIEEIKVSSKEIKLSSEEVKSFCEDVDLYLEEMKSKCEDFDASNKAFFNVSLQLKHKKNSNEETNASPEGKLLKGIDNKTIKRFRRLHPLFAFVFFSVKHFF